MLTPLKCSNLSIHLVPFFSHQSIVTSFLFSVPENLPAPSVSPVNETAILIEWVEPVTPNGFIVNYLIFLYVQLLLHVLLTHYIYTEQSHQNFYCHLHVIKDPPLLI